MSRYSTKLLGFGDNVVDIYDHLKTMYPGGNCVNVSVYGKMAGCEKTAYMGYFLSLIHILNKISRNDWLL